ncbi:MAG: LysR family transcriptional regulator [Rubrivivax sp.]|nr:LysR family transcriptional regulator [Rubrivivax sp.]
MSAPRLDQLRVKQLRFVGLLAQLGSLAATAEHLAMTPSAASMMLKEIEGLFGTKLFRRQGRGMALTAEGRALLPRCQTVLGEVGAMDSTLQGAGSPVLRLGAFPHTTTTVLPSIVKRLVTGPTAWRVQLVDGSADELLQRLLHGEIDLMLGRLPRHAAGTPAIHGLAQRVLYEGSLSVVAARSHALAGRRSVPLAELLNWPWILPPTQSTTRVALVDAFLRRGLAPPAPVVESPSFFYSLSVVAHTELLTCCAHSAALHSGHGTSILPVTIGPEPTPVCLVWRKQSAEAQRAVDQLALPGL